MIDEMNIGNKIGYVNIGIRQDSSLEKNMIEEIYHKYVNIWGIGIFDYNDSINESEYKQLITIVQKKTLLGFGLGFRCNLRFKD